MHKVALPGGFNVNEDSKNFWIISMEETPGFLNGNLSESANEDLHGPTTTPMDSFFVENQ